MNIRKWMFLFFSSLGIGAVTALIVSALLHGLRLPFEGGSYLRFTPMDIGISILFGMLFSTISQMGFFAYLTLNYVAHSIFRKRRVWVWVQAFITIVVLFEFFFLRYLYFEKSDGGFLPYIVAPLCVLAAALAVAYWKVKATNGSAWVPTLFFMCAGTIIEAVPSLQQNNTASAVFMMTTLFLCNAWQILWLHRLVRKGRS